MTYLKQKQNRCLFLSFGREVGKERVSAGVPRICCQAHVRAWGEDEQTQAMWEPPALGLAALQQVPAGTKCEMKLVGRCYWGGDRHTQNQNQGKVTLKWDSKHGFLSLSPTQTVEGVKVLLRCNFRGKGDRQGHMDQRNQLKNKNKTKKPKYMEAKALQTI